MSRWIALITIAFAALLIWGIFGLEIARKDSSRSLRTILCYFEDRELKLSHLSPDQRTQAIAVYAHALSLVGEPPCDLEGVPR